MQNLWEQRTNLDAALHEFAEVWGPRLGEDKFCNQRRGTPMINHSIDVFLKFYTKIKK